MKTIKLALTVAALAFATITNAVEKPKMNVIPLNSERAIVAVTNENPAIFEVSIETENGELVYYKQTNEAVTDFKQVYDFKDLAAGNYVLNMKVNDTKLINDFEVSGNGIEVGESKVRFAPYFDYENGELKLSYLNFDKENLKLYFYNNEGLVYQTRLGREFNITTGYDLSKLDKGSYRVVLASNDEEFTYNLVK
ncbi:hypothetical protein SAMN05444274_106151 [Mariniphaga anaerophila]|uniref:Por secretion system C-terminal sorting domain-containing protein n=1 Tax=Mariniphaga anaerophila TaxID=1484053 RepID=A0A1M5CJG8_9BACT|nr:hypothetical protein [Mariniphaga anaerophila]SHF54850.1 hypothetical protein SAMN05444274_106151 [Mariniphaga anaerophila]